MISRSRTLLCVCLTALVFPGLLAASPKHLFILSGRSNMAGHRPEEAFTPSVSQALGEENVLIVQDAVGGQPIQRWHKGWQAPDGTVPDKTGDLYDRLMTKVKEATNGHELESVTFLWMQGERDAREEHGSLCRQLAGRF